MKIFLSNILVLSFIIISLPLAVGHNHENHNHNDNHNCDNHNQNLLIDDFDECFLCDFDYTNLNASVKLPLSSKLFLFSEFTCINLIQNKYSLYSSFNSRGPPSA